MRDPFQKNLTLKPVKVYPVRDSALNRDPVRDFEVLKKRP